MSRKALPGLEAARRAARSYVTASVRARDTQYRFLGLAYLAYREGQRKPRVYAKNIEAILRRRATVPEQKRPFLFLLHALVGAEDEAPREALPQFSKLTSALEEIDRAFASVKPSVDDIALYIRDCGGVGGLYDLSRVGDPALTSGDRQRSSVAALLPGEIALSDLPASVTKVGRRFRLRVSDWEPGEHVVKIRVGRGGFIQAILDADSSDEEAA